MAEKVAEKARVDSIMDNSPEMEFGSAEYLAALAGASKPAEKKAESPKDEADEKVENEKPESTSDEAEAEKDEHEDKDLEPDENEPASVKALRKELKRVRAANRDKEDKLEKLEAQVTELAKKSDTKDKTDAEKTVDKLVKMADADYDRVKGEWDDERIEAAAALSTALANRDEDAAKEARARVQRAKSALALIGDADKERAKIAVRASDEDREVTEAIETSLGEVQDTFYKALPGLKDPDSDAFKAGEKEFNRHKVLMKKMGPAGQMLAVALAIIRNPKLVGRDPVETRKELINNVEEALTKGLNAGVKGGGAAKGVVNMPSLENPQAFEDYIERLKGGG